MFPMRKEWAWITCSLWERKGPGGHVPQVANGRGLEVLFPLRKGGFLRKGSMPSKSSPFSRRTSPQFLKGNMPFSLQVPYFLDGNMPSWPLPFSSGTCAPGPSLCRGDYAPSWPLSFSRGTCPPDPSLSQREHVLLAPPFVEVNICPPGPSLSKTRSVIVEPRREQVIQTPFFLKPILAIRLTCIACFSPISRSILNRFLWNFARSIFESPAK